MKLSNIISALEDYAPLNLQESWDNSGLQIGSADGDITGVLVCLDVTEAIIAEAVARSCNLVVSHHPLIFKGVKSITGRTPAERTIAAAIRAGVAVYSSHTALDSTRGGVSYEMARRLGATVECALAPVDGSDSLGLGVIAAFKEPVGGAVFVAMLHDRFGIPAIKASAAYRPDTTIRRIALCGGSGGEFIAHAAAAGVDAYVTADVRYHDFLDNATNPMAIFDIGHFESELCARDIFMRVIKNKFPNFAVYSSEIETVPVKYI